MAAGHGWTLRDELAALQIEISDKWGRAIAANLISLLADPKRTADKQRAIAGLGEQLHIEHPERPAPPRRAPERTAMSIGEFREHMKRHRGR